MAERLTKKINKTIQDKYSLGSYLYYDFAEIDDTNKLLNKLGKLEDILEKYNLEVEELDERIYNGALNYIDKLKAENERDTWQKACELACDVILRFTDGCPCKADYFYQQAKTEENDE